MPKHLLTIDLDDVAQRMIDLGYNTQAIQDAYPSAPEDWSYALLDVLTDTYNLEGEITNIINQTNNTTMKPKLITADNSYLKFEGTSDQAFDFIDAMAQLDASKNIHDLVFNIEVALQREGFLDGDFNRVDDTPRWEGISRDEFDTLMERHKDDIEFADFRKTTIMSITIKDTEWCILAEDTALLDTYLLQRENITDGVTTYHKMKRN